MLAGDAESGLSLMHVTARLDAGDVILTSPLPLSNEETGGSLHDRLADLGPGLLERGLPLPGRWRRPADSRRTKLR
ncbi:MAG: formyltransferase family protein [Verrucomicrobiales bacterium]